MALDNKLIILRGNSGSGKSTAAKKLREASSRKIAIIEQDYIRREIFCEKDKFDNAVYIGAIKLLVEYALEKGYDVILEGILGTRRHKPMIQELLEKCPNNYIYYFDVSLEETVRRHETKNNKHVFGEKEMREWYKEKDLLGLPNEKVIPESNTLEETLEMILEETGL